jgi:hypothetical protein
MKAPRQRDEGETEPGRKRHKTETEARNYRKITEKLAEKSVSIMSLLYNIK